MFLFTCSVNVICVQLAENLLVERRPASFGNDDAVLSADLGDLATGDIESMLKFAHALDTDRSLLVHAVTNAPLDDAEIDTVFLTSIQTLVERLGIKQVTCQADREALQVVALALCATLSGSSFVSLTHHLDVGVVRSELSVCGDNGSIDLGG